MKFLWTNNGKPGSKLIRWGTNSKVSHFSILFADKIVLEAHAPRVHICWLDEFLTRHNVIYALESKESIGYYDQFRIIDPIISEVIGKPYDYRGLVYLGWRVLLKKLCNMPIGEYNKWNDKRQYFCVELSEPMQRIFVDLFGVDFGDARPETMTPESLWQIMRVAPGLKETAIE